MIGFATTDVVVTADWQRIQACHAPDPELSLCAFPMERSGIAGRVPNGSERQLVRIPDLLQSLS